VDQRRVVAFLAISFLVLILFTPKQPDKKDKKLPPAGAEQAQVEQPGEVPAEELAVSADSPAPPADVVELAVEVAEPAADVDLEYVSIGSVADDSPYRLLATLTSQGAGVRRVELASPRFRDLHDRGGYLGHLELAADTDEGLLVQSVGTGTPAATSGIQLGDRLLSAASATSEPTDLNQPQDLVEVLAKHKPGSELKLKVVRGDEQLDIAVALRRRPLEVLRPEAENVLMRDDKLPAGSISPPSFQFTFAQIGNAKIGVDASEIVGLKLRDDNWKIVDHDETSVTFRKQLPKYRVEVLKRFSIEPVPAEKLAETNYPGYGLKLDIEVRNLGQEVLEVVYQLDGPNGLPMEGWWYAHKIGRNWGSTGIRDVVARYDGSKTVQFGPADIAEGDVEPLQGNSLSYIGVDAQYFSAVVMPMKTAPGEKWIDKAETISLSPEPGAKEKAIEGRYVNATFRLSSLPSPILAGKSLQHSYEIFTGPKRPKLLANYQTYGGSPHTLGDLMYYGWFGAVAKVMLGVLHFFYAITRNYGIAIILLTVLVRSCMFPISRKQAQSMAKMQLLKPEMDRLKEKYKNDMQKQSQAMQELYRKHNINPVAGCLPMFIQLPIFLGLYRALMVDVELRQAPLLGDAILWCSNLSAPDMFFDWSPWMPDFINSGEGITGLGPYLNVLPLVTVVMFLLQQKMFMPEPANEQAAMQQKIMKFMMLFMGFMFFKVAAGLCLYFIASSIWGIAERKLIPAPTAPPTTTTDSPTFTSDRGNKNGQPKNKRPTKKKKKR